MFNMIYILYAIFLLLYIIFFKFIINKHFGLAGKMYCKINNNSDDNSNIKKIFFTYPRPHYLKKEKILLF